MILKDKGRYKRVFAYISLYLLKSKMIKSLNQYNQSNPEKDKIRVVLHQSN